MNNGVLDLSYTGLVTNEYGTWYIYNGQLANWREGIELIGDKAYYVYKGQLAEWYTGELEEYGNLYQIVNGVVTA